MNEEAHLATGRPYFSIRIILISLIIMRDGLDLPKRPRISATMKILVGRPRGAHGNSATALSLPRERLPRHSAPALLLRG